MRGYFKVKVFKIKVFKVFFRRKASPFIDKSGAKPPIFSQSQKKKAFFGDFDFLDCFVASLLAMTVIASEAKQLVYLAVGNPVF